MGADGIPLWLTCALLGAPWAVLASWRSAGGTLRTTLRGTLGGIAAFESAWLAYGLLQVAGIELRWEQVSRGGSGGLAVAGAIGIVEEGAKLVGIALALSAGRRSLGSVLRTTGAVVAVFAALEAALALRGAGWTVVLLRAAFGSVAHAVLAAPLAVAIASTGGAGWRRAAPRLLLALALSATLHSLGDWSVARPGWGRHGFAATLLAPTLWFYAYARRCVRSGALEQASALALLAGAAGLALARARGTAMRWARGG